MLTLKLFTLMKKRLSLSMSLQAHGKNASLSRLLLIISCLLFLGSSRKMLHLLNNAQCKMNSIFYNFCIPRHHIILPQLCPYNFKKHCVIKSICWQDVNWSAIILVYQDFPTFFSSIVLLLFTPAENTTHMWI